MNLVLVTVDTLRWDLHYAGNPRALSPNLDALAARSVVIDQAYALSSYTGRSIGPLLAGRYPTECPNNMSHFTHYFASNTMLAERLRDAGLVTLGAASHSYFRMGYGLPQGISHWDYSAHPPDDTDMHVTDDLVTDRALSLLRRHAGRGQRFYLWVHYIDPHPEYLWHADQPSFGNGTRARYDGEVLFTDRQFGRLLAGVRALPHGERTAVVVTADHGELFHEHGISRHGRELWENLVRVPWIVYVPGLAPRHVTTPRGHIDLVPTVLELLRVPLPPPGTLHGVSLAGDLVGLDDPPRPILMDLPEGPLNTPRRAILDDGWKLILRPNGPELYHVLEDREELHDLLASEPAQRQRLEGLLGTLTAGFRGPWRRASAGSSARH
jgi:arylsulfatase A-like enzyme